MGSSSTFVLKLRIDRIKRKVKICIRNHGFADIFHRMRESGAPVSIIVRVTKETPMKIRLLFLPAIILGLSGCSTITALIGK